MEGPKPELLIEILSDDYAKKQFSKIMRKRSEIAGNSILMRDVRVVTLEKVEPFGAYILKKEEEDIIGKKIRREQWLGKSILRFFRGEDK